MEEEEEEKIASLAEKCIAYNKANSKVRRTSSMHGYVMVKNNEVSI